MEQAKDVYDNWVVASNGVKTYIGEEVEYKGNYLLLEKAFELKILEMHHPDPSGRGVQTVLQNLHVTEALCSEPTKISMFVTSYRRLEWLGEQDRKNHIGFIESAKKAFAEQRMRSLGIEIARA